MDWQSELKSYIEKCLKLGFSKDEIRVALRSVGWKDDEINNSFSPGKSYEVQPRKIDLVPASPSFLLLSSADEKFPSAVKTAIPLLLALLARRAEALKRAARTTRLKLTPKMLAIGRKSAPLAITADSHSQSLLLAAPSRRTIWFMRFQLISDRVFSKVESAAVIIGKIILLPVISFGLAVKSLGRAARAVLDRRDKKPARSAALAGISGTASSPVAILIGEKFPEHIIILDIFKLAGRMFRTRRLRTFLTISGISVGIGTILFLVSFGYGLQNILFERITTEEALLTLDVTPPSDNAILAMDDAAIEKVSGIEGVAEIGKMISLNGEMVFGESSAAGFIYAVDAGYQRMLGAKMAAGNFTDSPDRAEVVISSSAVKLLGWGDAPDAALGKELSFVAALPKKGGEEVEAVSLEGKYRVAGVVDDPFSVFAYFPIEKMSGLKLPPYSQLKVKMQNTDLLEPARDKILTMGFLVSMLTETVDQARKVFNVVKIVLGLFGVITLIVSAIGMLNTMTIALLERTQEVGIMKAVGASNFDIWKLFLAEAVMMGFLGGVGGIATGYISAEIFNYGINLLARTFGGQSLNLFQAPGWFVLTIVVFSSCIGVVTGLWPARRAAGLDPLDALKYK